MTFCFLHFLFFSLKYKPKTRKLERVLASFDVFMFSYNSLQDTLVSKQISLMEI